MNNLLIKLFPKIFKRVIIIEISLKSLRQIFKVVDYARPGDNIKVTDNVGNKIIFKIKHFEPNHE